MKVFEGFAFPRCLEKYLSSSLEREKEKTNLSVIEKNFICMTSTGDKSLISSPLER